MSGLNIVIGAGSYTAFNLVKELSKNEEVLCVLSHRNVNVNNYYLEHKIKTVPNIKALSQEKLTKESKIYYLGGAGSQDHTFADIEKLSRAHITGVTQSLEVARRFGCSYLSCSSYWELIENSNKVGINLYATFLLAQNKILEFYAYEYGVSSTKVFLADVYGLNDWRPKLLQGVIYSIESGETLSMGNASQVIAPIYISDVVEDLINIMNLSTSSAHLLSQLVLKPEKTYTLFEFINRIESITLKKVKIEWNANKKIRKDVENFPNNNYVYLRKTPYINLDEGLRRALNLN
jgi:nucleoside-diphosphate-sugar epimerase